MYLTITIYSILINLVIQLQVSVTPTLVLILVIVKNNKLPCLVAPLNLTHVFANRDIMVHIVKVVFIDSESFFRNYTLMLWYTQNITF